MNTQKSKKPIGVWRNVKIRTAIWNMLMENKSKTGVPVATFLEKIILENLKNGKK